MKIKLIKYSFILLTGFYLGNVTSIKLPEPDKVMQKLETFINKFNKHQKKLRKKIRTEIKRETTQKTGNEFYINPFEKKMIDLVNQQRELNGVKKLKFSKEGLFKMARQHSNEMMKLGYFSHTSPVETYKTLKERLDLAGEKDYLSAGENIAFISCCGNCDERHVEASMFGGELQGIETIEGRVEISAMPFMQNNCVIGQKERGLMFSPGHKANILNPEFEYIGVGIITGKGKYLDYEGMGMWITQNFATY